MTLPVRQPRSARRGRSISRASSRLTRIRLGAAFVLLLSGAALYGLTTSPAFTLDPGSVEVAGLRYTDPAAARVALGLEEGAHPNLFHLPTARLEAALMTLPTVRTARVAARLPAELHVAVEERVPILQWGKAGARWLVDVEGVVLAPAPLAEESPLIDDQRSATLATGGQAEAVMAPGELIPPLDLEVARLLGAVTPGHLGSDGATLALSVVDEDGWVLTSDAGWRAVFGYYTLGSRPPTSIQEQLTCLQALLASEEQTFAEITLSLADDACGTFRPRASPSPAPAPSGRRGDATPSGRP
ncbi:hypothetical protein BH20CHL5_BH20CHL5_00370 [soil metagenome]